MEARTRNNITFRRYKCQTCGAYLFTKEIQDGQVKYKLSKIVRELKGGQYER